MSSIGQSILMAPTITVNKYASSNLQAVHRTQGKAANPITPTLSTNINVGFGRRGVVLSTVIATTLVPDPRTELLKSIHHSPQFFYCLELLAAAYVLYLFLDRFLVVLLTQILNYVVMKLLSEYLKKSEENKEKNDKERLESYYKRNYKDYFELMEGTLKGKNGQLSDTEKGILDWLQSNK